MKPPKVEATLILAEKIQSIQRLVSGLQFTASRLEWPTTDTTQYTPEALERLSAFTERFSKLQDVLASAMRHSVILRGENPQTFSDVLAIMEKVCVVNDQQDWINMRLLRNKAAHDYSNDGTQQAEYFNTLHESMETLLAISHSFVTWCNSKH